MCPVTTVLGGGAVQTTKPLCKKTGGSVESTCILECEGCEHDAGKCLDLMMDYYRKGEDYVAGVS